METIRYQRTDGGRIQELALDRVLGTEGVPYNFGDPPQSLGVDVRAFFMGIVPAHCTVFKRYEIARDFHDGCISFRFVLAEPRTGRAAAPNDPRS